MVNHDRTFTTHDDNYIHISAPSDALRKIQLTIHVVVNAGAGDKNQGFFDIGRKVIDKRISKKYQEIWDERSNVFSKIIHELIIK